MERWALLTRTGEPWIWDFGSAARVHKLQAPWLDPTHSVGGNTGLAGSIGPESGLVARAVREIRNVLEDEGVASMPLGVDMAETEMFLELTRAGIDVRNGQQVMLRAREIKSQDEIILLSQAAAMVDGVYQDIFEALKPGIRESDIVALANKRLYEMGSEHVEAINSIAGERCSPHPHVFSDRLIRPGDTAYFDIIQAHNGYRTCYYRTFVVGRATAAQTRRVQAGKRVDRRGDCPRQARHRHRRDRSGMAGRPGVRLPRRDGGLRSAVRPWRRAVRA